MKPIIILATTAAATAWNLLAPEFEQTVNTRHNGEVCDGGA